MAQITRRLHILPVLTGLQVGKKRYTHTEENKFLNPSLGSKNWNLQVFCEKIALTARMTQNMSMKTTQEKRKEAGDLAKIIIVYFVSAVKEIRGFPYFPTTVDAGMAEYYAENLLYKGSEFPNYEELITFYLQGNLYTISLASALSKYSINQFNLKNNGWRDKPEN